MPYSPNDIACKTPDLFPLNRFAEEAGQKFGESESDNAKVHELRIEAHSRIALVGTYLPRKCGIATYTGDVRNSIIESYPQVSVDVYAIDEPRSHMQYEDPVRCTIDAADSNSFADTARRINASGADIVWIQHEFGLYGGPAGDNLLALTDAVAAPLIVTLHTILANPDPQQLRVMHALVARAWRLIVMSETSRDVLMETYGADADQIAVIPHGVPDRPFGRTEHFKQKLGLANKHVLMTFGLLSPGKGIENVIAALPGIAAQFPDTVYCIIGATHPKLIEQEGERYRDQLKAQIAELGVTANVRWYDLFCETQALLDIIEAADIFITPYPGANQSTSGTLSYAVALGKAIISTPYVHAAELLDDGHGVLVPFNDSGAIGDAVTALLGAPDTMQAMQQRAYVRGRDMLWSRFAARSMDIIRETQLASAPHQHEISFTAGASPSLKAISHFTDDTGIFQHSSYGVADRNHGYCIDDNARALILMHRLPESDRAEAARLARIYAAFVNHGWNDATMQFRNFMGYDRQWLEDVGSEDSSARALWALGVTIAESDDDAMRHWAIALFKRAAPAALELDSPRALAFSALAAAAVVGAREQDAVAAKILERTGEKLMSLLEAVRRPDWTWFEIVLAYDNCRLPEALLRAGHALGNPEMVKCAIETLEWIFKQQASTAGNFRPVGSDSFGREFASALPFDQQPVEATAAIDACELAYRITGDPRWVEQAHAAYNWFFGANDRGVALADIATGICHDGITPRGANANQGAESLLAFHLATATMRKIAFEQRSRAKHDNETEPATEQVA